MQAIEIPDAIKCITLPGPTIRLIDDANEQIESFMLADHEVIENFVTCDFFLVAQTLRWIQANHLLAGNRFCELGSGFGVVAMLAADRGMESIGIEIEPVLVRQSIALADRLGVSVQFFCGSFVPRGAGVSRFATEMKRVETEEGDVYREIGLAMEDFDLLFAFPWPGEEPFFEAVFDACACDGAMLLTYQGREGMSLLRKT